MYCEFKEKYGIEVIMIGINFIEKWKNYICLNLNNGKYLTATRKKEISVKSTLSKSDRITINKLWHAYGL